MPYALLTTRAVLFRAIYLPAGRKHEGEGIGHVETRDNDGKDNMKLFIFIVRLFALPGAVSEKP